MFLSLRGPLRSAKVNCEFSVCDSIVGLKVVEVMGGHQKSLQYFHHV